MELKNFAQVAQELQGIPFMSEAQGRIVYDHISSNRVQKVLELGTAHGVGAAYMAAALSEGGSLTTVDFDKAVFDPSPEETLDKAGVAAKVTLVREYSSYTWWLKKQIEHHSDKSGNCQPVYDFIYLDGAKNWTIDGMAVILAEKLLKPGGWLLLDDLGWMYSDDPSRRISDGITVRDLSADERSEPHLRAVFNLIVAPHPSFTELKIVDDWWGWARKDPEANVKWMHYEESRSFSAVVLTGMRRTRRKIMRTTRTLHSRR